MPKANTVQLGDEVRSRVTKYKGIVYGFRKMFNGNIMADVKMPMKPSATEMPDAYYFDVQELEILKKGKVKAPAPPEDPNPKNIEIGDVVKDIATGDEGMVISIETYFNGCLYCSFHAKSKKDASAKDTFRHQSESRLEIVKKGKRPKEPEKPKKRSGGPSTRSLSTMRS